jgi:hypothetical protein
MTTATEKPTHVWVFDVNNRVYPKKEPGQLSAGPIYRKHWVKREIIGETSRSWLIGPAWGPVKIPKKGARPSAFLFSQDAVDDDVWMHDHRYKIERMILTLSPEKLRQVATIVGYKPAD